MNDYIIPILLILFVILLFLFPVLLMIAIGVAIGIYFRKPILDMIDRIKQELNL